MNRDELIKDFLKNFKPKEEQSWKSCYFFTHYLKKNHNKSKIVKNLDFFIVGPLIPKF